MFVGHVSDMLVRELGIAWAEKGRLSVRFVHTAGPGDKLYTSATVKAVALTSSGNRVTLGVRMVNQHGERVVEAEAEAILP
jgi:acyl dehydratase